MRLKCIGGKCDSQFHHVEENFRIGDLIRIPAKVEFTIANFEDEVSAFREGRTPTNMRIPYYTYRLSILHFSSNANDTLKFLVPCEWSDREAIIYQFGK